ncbi:MAG: hypothetical protein ABIG67_04795 [Pseudomonadota bacterium]
MKKLTLLLIWIFLGTAIPVRAEEFLGVPLMAGGHAVKETKTMVLKAYNLSQEQVMDFYKASFKDQKDLKFRTRARHVEFEEHGSLPWHKVTVAKNEKGETTTVLITKDSWTWILGTLLIRFIGVFIVLLILYLAMNVATGIIARSVQKGNTP